MTGTPASFAARLKQLRIKKGESLQEAANAVGISKPHFWELERGDSRNPTKEVLERIADHYKCTIAYLLGEQTQEEGTIGALFRDVREHLDPHQLAQLQALVDAMKQSKS